MIITYDLFAVFPSGSVCTFLCTFVILLFYGVINDNIMIHDE